VVCGIDRSIAIELSEAKLYMHAGRLHKRTQGPGHLAAEPAPARRTRTARRFTPRPPRCMAMCPGGILPFTLTFRLGDWVTR